jgi:hypothetical protein
MEKAGQISARAASEQKILPIQACGVIFPGDKAGFVEKAGELAAAKPAI